MATAASGNAAVGTIKVVIGDVKIIGVDGVARQAQVGDKVFAKESIQTAANAVVQVQLENGRMLDLGRDSKIALDDDVLNVGQTPTTAPAPTQDVASIQAQIAAGADPSKVADATAAGGAPGAGAGADGSGGSGVVIDQANSTGVVTSGFGTEPAAIAFPELQPALQTVIAPEIAVSVVVGVQIGGPGGPGIVLIPGGTPITGGVSGATVLEGSQGSGGASHQVTFLITLSEVSTAPITVTYTIVPGSATNPDDYFDGAPTGTVTIPAGYIGFTITENIVADLGDFRVS